MCPLPGRAHFRRPFADPGRRPGRQGLSDVVDVIATQGVTWIHSYVAGEGRKNFCVYDGPNAEAVRAAAERNGLPVDRPSGGSVNVPAVGRQLQVARSARHRAPGARARPGVARGLRRRRRPEPGSAARPGSARDAWWRCRPMLSGGTDTTAGSAVLSWPSCGVVIGGLGEKCSADLFTVTGNFSVPIGVPAGRGCVQPQLSVSVSTGNGNGPFGLGWELSLPGIGRRTSHGWLARPAARFPLNRFDFAAVLPMGKNSSGSSSRPTVLLPRWECPVLRHDHWSVSWLR